MSHVLNTIINSLDTKYRATRGGHDVIVSLRKRTKTTLFHIWELDDIICLNKRSNCISKADPLLLNKVKSAVEEALG